MEKKTISKMPFMLPAAAAAIWALVLLFAFFSNRGEDVGRLWQLTGNLGGGPFFGSGITESFVGAAAALLIFLSWFGAGSFLLSFIRVQHAADHSHLLEFAMSITVGAAAWSVIWFFFGLAGIYNRGVAIAALAVGLALALKLKRRIREASRESRVPEKAGLPDVFLAALAALPVALAFVAALAPPTAKDTLLYHFSVPKAFIAQGSSEFITGNIASYLPLGTEMHTIWAMLLGGIFSRRAGEAAAGAVVWTFFPLLLAVIFGWARELKIARRPALVAVLMMAAVPTAYHVAASAYIDIALTLFITLAIYSLSRWWSGLENGWLIYAAIFLGAALSAKLTALFVFASFALLMLLRARSEQTNEPGNIPRMLAAGFGALFLAVSIASPWYLRTWSETGSPIFPFYMSIWPGEAPGWDLERSILFQGLNSQYGGHEKTVLDYLAAPWNLSVAAQPELAVHFDGVLGISFLLGLPLLLLALWKFGLPAEITPGLGVAGIMFLFWLFSSQQLRYLLPILPVLAIASVAAANVISERLGGNRAVFLALFTMAAAAGMPVSMAWFLQKAPLRVVLGGENRNQYLSRNIDYYPYYIWLNSQSAPDAKTWLINMRRDSYHLDRPYFSDYLFEDWTLRKMVWESGSASELKAKAASMGIQYILTRHDFLFDYKLSPLVDDSKPVPENEAKLKMARELVLDQERTVLADKKFSLVRVF